MFFPLWRSDHGATLSLASFLTNVRHLPGAKLVAREEWGRNRHREVYRVPMSILINRLIVRVSFSNSGYISLNLCMVNGNNLDCYWCPRYEDICRELASKLRIIGGERQLAEFYINFVPRLANEIKSVAEKTNTRRIFFAGHAQRFEEVLNDPHLSLFTSMVLDTWQGRVLSLQEKISHIAELWVLAKIIEAINGETLTLRNEGGTLKIELGGEWWIEFTKNYPFAYIRSRTIGKDYTLFYQPSIYPHIISGFLEGLQGKRLHLIPDILIFEGIIAQFLNWGELHKIIEQGIRPLLVVEVKSGFETSEWRKPQYVLKQLQAYMAYLKPKRIALAVLTELGEPSLRAELKRLNVDVFERLLSPEIQAEFAQYIHDVLR